jgi:hypothetical protein
MIDYLAAGEKRYPFHFSHKTFYMFTQANRIDYSNLNGSITADYDKMLEIFVYASQRGAAKASEPGNVLTADQLEDLFTQTPRLFDELFEMFQNAMTTMFGAEEGTEQTGKTVSQ